jgi:tRNA uridine 5-carbamoylmethylation protein Kti12
MTPSAFINNTSVILNEEIQTLAVECAAGVNALMKIKEKFVNQIEKKLDSENKQAQQIEQVSEPIRQNDGDENSDRFNN